MRGGFRATEDNRLAFGLAVAFGVQHGAFKGNFARVGKEGVFQALDTISHFAGSSGD